MTKIKLAASNIGWSGQDDETIYGYMRQYGYRGVETAPTRLMGAAPYRDLAAARARAGALRAQYGLCIPSMQSIWYGQAGNIFDEEDAARLAAYTRRAVDFAAAVGCGSLVFGCPRNRFVPPGRAPGDAAGFFAGISAYARAHGVYISLEANPAVYGTNFCNTSAEAFAWARQVPGLRVNYDVGTLLQNGESLAVLAENLPFVRHIHISEPGLAPIEPRAVHTELAALLRGAGYDGFVSVEMKAQPLAVVARVLAYTAEVFA